MIMLIIGFVDLRIRSSEDRCRMEVEFSIGMLDSQHYTVAFSSPRNLLIKKADGEDLAGYTNSPLTPAMLVINLVELIGIEPTTS